MKKNIIILQLLFFILIFNCSKKNTDIFLLDKNEINKIQEHGSTILIDSIYNYSKLSKNDLYKTIKLLLQKGADTSIFSEANQTALGAAILVKDYNIVKMLIEYNADPNLLLGYDESPLQYSLRSKDTIKIAILLIKKGADINYINKTMDDSDSILMKSIILNDKKLIKLIIDKGADINYKNQDGLIAMDYAKKIGNKDIIDLLK